MSGHARKGLLLPSTRMNGSEGKREAELLRFTHQSVRRAWSVASHTAAFKMFKKGVKCKVLGMPKQQSSVTNQNQKEKLCFL